MPVEGGRRDTLELLPAPFSKAPTALDAVDVCRALHKLVLSVMDSKMCGVAHVNQASRAAPAVTVADGIECAATAPNGLYSALFAPRHDLRLEAAVSFAAAEDERLASGSPTAFAAHWSGTEVRLINCDRAGGEGRGARALFGAARSAFEKDHGDTCACQAGTFSCLTSRQSARETAHELPKLTLVQFGTPILAV